MTIPIQPGPWSFLVGLGETFGEIAKQKETQRQQEFKEKAERRRDALAAVQVLGHLRDRGYIAPEVFNDPDTIKTFELAGLPMPSSTPTPEETKRQGQSSYLSSIGIDEKLFAEPEPQRGNLTQSGVSRPAAPRQPLTTEQRVAIGVPTQADVLKPTVESENLPVSGYADVIDRLAGEAVSTAWVSGGMRNLPTIQDARKFLDANPNVAPFKDKITDGALARQIEALRAKVEDEKAKAAAAANVGRGSGSDTASRRITALEKQRDNVQKDIEYFRGPLSILDPRLKPLITAAAAQGRKISNEEARNILIRQYEKRVEEYDTEINRLNEQNPLPSGTGGGVSSASTTKINTARKNIISQYPKSQWKQAADYYLQSNQISAEEHAALLSQLDTQQPRTVTPPPR